MKIASYLTFNGQCREAFTFYQQVLGGEITMMETHRGTPAAEHVPESHLDMILHASLVVGENTLMGSDAPPEWFSQPQGFSVAINLEDVAEAQRIFSALSENGTVKMAFDKTFFSAGFGMLIDRFGTPWMVNCDAVQ